MANPWEGWAQRQEAKYQPQVESGPWTQYSKQEEGPWTQFQQKPSEQKKGTSVSDYGLGTIQAAINFISTPLRAIPATATGTVAALAQKDPNAFVNYFGKVMDKLAIPENEWGKTTSHFLNLPFEYLDKAAKGAGEGLVDGMTQMGYSPEFAATAATILHAEIDAVPMLMGLVRGKESSPKTKEEAKPKEVPILKEKIPVEKPPIEFEKGLGGIVKKEISLVPKEDYRYENGLDVADFFAERKSENLAADIKAREQDAAWEQYKKTHDPEISKEDAWKLYEEQKARGYFSPEHKFNPQQSSPLLDKSSFKGRRGREGGAIDPEVFREGFKKIAGFFTITEPKLKEVRQSLDDEMYSNYQMKIANENTYNTVMKDLRDKGYSEEIGQKLVHFYEGDIKNLSEEEQFWKQEAFDPAMKIYQDALENALKAGGKEVELNEGVFPRFALDKGGFLDRLLEGSRTGMGGLAGRYARTPSSLKGRTVFALDDGKGNRQVVTLGKDNTLTAWDKGQPEVIAKFDGPLKAGMEFEDGRKLTHATLKEASDNTDVRYFQDGVEGLLRKASELQAYANELNTLNKIKEDPNFSSFAKHEDAKDVPDNFRHLRTNVPQLREYKFDPHIAETLEDYLTPGPEGILPKSFEMANNFLIKSLFLVPLPHIANEGLHWIPERGWGWMTPEGYQRLTNYSRPAIESVLKQDGFQKEIAKNAGSPLYPRVANEMYWKERTKASLKNLQNDAGFKQLAKEIGMSPVELVKLISDKSNQSMWAVRDMMYTEAVMERMAMEAKEKGLPIGTDYTSFAKEHPEALRSAIKEVEKHMPNYRIPNRVLGSRSLARIMKNPFLTVFSYYHYGMAKSFVEYAKALKGSPKDVKTAVGQMAVLGTLYYLLYPELDKFISKVTGKPLKMRRAGGLALMENIGKVAEGEKTPQDVIRGLVTPSPQFQIPLELLFNREMFTGRKIYDPDKSDQGKRFAEYFAKQVTPLRTAMQPIEGKKSVEDVLLEYFGDVKSVDEMKELKKELKRALK